MYIFFRTCICCRIASRYDIMLNMVVVNSFAFSSKALTNEKNNTTYACRSKTPLQRLIHFLEKLHSDNISQKTEPDRTGPNIKKEKAKHHLHKGKLGCKFGCVTHMAAQTHIRISFSVDAIGNNVPLA